MPSSIKSAKVSVDQFGEEQFVDVSLDIDAEFGGKEARLKLERKLLRKLDTRMSILILIYILNYIDRNNAAAARLKGFNTILSILYVGYILMQIPSNMFLNYIGRPSIYLPACMMDLGCHFLPDGSAAFFPGALFLLSKWYKRSELGNAFGSLMASSILSGMQGKMGHAAWSSACLEDVGVSDDEETERKGSRFPGFFEALSDWKVYWLALALTSLVVSLSFNAFFPTLTATLGYSSTVTLLLCAPPWIFATIVAFACQQRFFHIVVPLSIGIVGFIIALSTMRLAARYFALFLMAQSYAGFICFLTWTSNTFARPASKRAVALAFVNAFSQLGNIAGSYVWQKSWGPTYNQSYAICISTNGLCIVMCFIFRQVLAKQNEQMEQRESSAGQRKGYRYIL
ncbi:MFS general substrate transporter [Lactarius indigo]|nr:MFS general substrate transporter [Lactarius indigo]